MNDPNSYYNRQWNTIPSAFRCQALKSICEDSSVFLCRRGLFPFKAQSVLTLPVSSYHKQTHIASPPEPLITTLLSCRLSYVRLHNTRSVWVIFHNLGVLSPHWHYHQIPSGVRIKGAGQVWQHINKKQIRASFQLWGEIYPFYYPFSLAGQLLTRVLTSKTTFFLFSWGLEWRSQKGRDRDTAKLKYPFTSVYHNIQGYSSLVCVTLLCFKF